MALDKSLGTLGLVCQPYRATEYSAMWQEVRVILALRDGNTDGLTTNRISVNTLLRDVYNVRKDGSLVPIDTQLCPPGYVLNGIRLALETAVVQAVEAVSCLPVNTSFAPLPGEIKLRGITSASGVSLDQEIGTTGPNADSRLLSCPSDEVIATLYMSSGRNTPVTTVGIGCRPLEGP